MLNAMQSEPQVLMVWMVDSYKFLKKYSRPSELRALQPQNGGQSLALNLKKN